MPDAGPTIRIEERVSGLDVRASLLPELAPATVALVLGWLGQPRSTASLHAMWTGPEISNAIDLGDLGDDVAARTLPVENGTVTPREGDLIFLRIPERLWGGNPRPILDIGLFYGPGGRLLFPVGWLTGSVFGRVAADGLDALARGCRAIRDGGAARLHWSRLE